VVIRILSLIASLSRFSLDTQDLEDSLREFEQQIEEILGDNRELREYTEKIKEIRKGESQKKGTPKVINIKDFIRYRDS
jgi:hypothetical protein